MSSFDEPAYRERRRAAIAASARALKERREQAAVVVAAQQAIPLRLPREKPKGRTYPLVHRYVTRT